MTPEPRENPPQDSPFAFWHWGYYEWVAFVGVWLIGWLFAFLTLFVLAGFGFGQ